MHAKALVDAEEDGEEEGALARLEALDLVLSRAFAAEGFRRVEALCVSDYIVCAAFQAVIINGTFYVPVTSSVLLPTPLCDWAS